MSIYVHAGPYCIIKVGGVCVCVCVCVAKTDFQHVLSNGACIYPAAAVGAALWFAPQSIDRALPQPPPAVQHSSTCPLLPDEQPAVAPPATAQWRHQLLL